MLPCPVSAHCGEPDNTPNTMLRPAGEIHQLGATPVWQAKLNQRILSQARPAARPDDERFRYVAVQRMNEEQFAEVVENYTSFVYNVAYRMMNNPDDADDVVQDAFISAYRAKDRFRGDAQVTTWLYRITVNAALMRIRKDKRRVQMTAPEDSYTERNVADWEETPDKAALNSELSREIKSKIALLPEDLRTAVVLRDVQGMSNTEAAEILDISISALKARLHRGRVALRDMLDDYIKQRTD